MKIKELQEKIAEALNGVEELVQGGCKAFAEDSMTVLNDIAQQLTSKAGVAICIVTPTVAKNGECFPAAQSERSAAEGATSPRTAIAAEFALAIQCSEKPELNRKQPGHMTALDAAEIVALSLDGEQFSFVDIRQTGDAATRTVTATANFNFSGKISSTQETEE